MEGGRERGGERVSTRGLGVPEDSALQACVCICVRVRVCARVCVCVRVAVVSAYVENSTNNH